MAFVQVEQFSLMRGVSRSEFEARDAEQQTWSYLHVPGIVRRTTALAADGEVLVVTIVGGAEPPGRAGGAAAAPPSPLAVLIDEATYRCSLYRDLDGGATAERG